MGYPESRQDPQKGIVITLTTHPEYSNRVYVSTHMGTHAGVRRYVLKRIDCHYKLANETWRLGVLRSVAPPRVPL